MTAGCARDSADDLWIPNARMHQVPLGWTLSMPDGLAYLTFIMFAGNTAHGR